jgi:prepilin-type processing-associated H-X9-DG protein
MTKFATLVLLAALADAPAEKAGAARARAIAPFVEDRTVAVLHLDLSSGKVDDPAWKATFTKLGAAGLADLNDSLVALRRLRAAGARDLFVVVSLVDVPDQPPFLVVPLGKGVDAKGAQTALKGIAWLEGLGQETLHGALVSATAPTRKRLRTLKPVPRPELAQALAGTELLRLVLVPTTDTARILEEVMPMLPDELGGGPIRPLSRGLRWAAVNVEAPRLGLRWTVQAADNASARALHQLLGEAKKALAKNKEARAAVPGLDKLLPLLAPKVAGDRLVLAMDEKALVPVLRPFIKQAAESREREKASEGLSALLTGMHSYHDAHNRFPTTGSYGPRGQPLLSWRVHLLPHLSQGALYKQFRLNEPWDSEHNKKLIAKMPVVYRPANRKLAAQYKTTYLAPRGEETMFPAKRGVRIQEVLDGTSNTILLIDADDDRAVVWTRPDDLTYDGKQPDKGLSARHGGKIMVGMADGSVQFLPGDIDKKLLHALFTRAGGEEVRLP